MYKAKQILPQGLGHGASPYGDGALNARPDRERYSCLSSLPMAKMDSTLGLPGNLLVQMPV